MSSIIFVFNPICILFMQEKKALKEEKMKLEEKYMWAIVDGVKEKVYSSLSLIPVDFFITYFLQTL